MGISVLLSKTASIMTQVILGYLFVDEQFGLLAYLLGSMALISGFTEIGLTKLLIQFQVDIENYRRSAVKVSFLFSLIGSFLLLVFVFSANKSADVENAVILIALVIPLYSTVQIYKARLSIALDIPFISRVEMQQAVLYSVVFVGMAYIGRGIEGFGMAMAVGQLFAVHKYRKRVHERKLINYSSGTNQVSPLILIWNLRWLLITTFAMSFALRGDYLVLAEILTLAELGIYYFAFMLTANLGLLIAAGVNTAFMPFLSRKLGNVNELAEFFLKNTFMFMYLSALLAGVFICLGDWIVSMIWQGRWEEAILPAIILVVSLPLKILAPISYALLEARGMWRERFLLVFVDAVSMAIAVYLGAIVGGLLGAVILISIQRSIVGYMIFRITCNLCTIKLNQTQSIIPLLVLICMLLILMLNELFAGDILINLLILTSFLTLSYCILRPYFLFLRFKGKSNNGK